MKSSNHVFAFILLCSVVYCRGQGTLVLGHFGSANPTTEGFNLLQAGNSSLTPVANDLGMSAWSISASAGTDIGQYTQILTADESEALSTGWILSVTLRISQPVNPGDSGIFVGFGGVVLNFGAQTDGNPAVSLNSTEYDFNGGGSGYQNYQVRFDASTDLASLWIDGTDWINNIPGSANLSSASLGWGESQHASDASYYANWSEVGLYAVPEPSSAALVLLGGGAWICARRKHRR